MSHKLFVGNLAYSMDETTLEGLFKEFGEIVSVKLIRDRDTGKSKGFGFVEYSSEDAATKSIEALNGKEIEGRALKVDKARPPQNRSGGGGNRNFRRGGGGGRGRF